jgi:hypothetical protein
MAGPLAAAAPAATVEPTAAATPSPSKSRRSALKKWPKKIPKNHEPTRQGLVGRCVSVEFRTPAAIRFAGRFFNFLKGGFVFFLFVENSLAWFMLCANAIGARIKSL